MIITYSILGQDAHQHNRGYWEATSDVLEREAPRGLEDERIYNQYVTGYGETSQDAIDNLIERLRERGLSGTLRRIA